MMTATEVRAFIAGRTVRAIDPATGQAVATVSYLPGGTCRIARADGTPPEDGVYGFSEHLYWTRYAAFRDGGTNSFYLVEQGPGRAQAWHDDGRRAFLLVHADEASTG